MRLGLENPPETQSRDQFPRTLSSGHGTAAAFDHKCGAIRLRLPQQRLVEADAIWAGISGQICSDQVHQRLPIDP